MLVPFDNSFARLGEPFFARLSPDPVQAPKLIAVNDALAETLGIDAQWLRSEDGLAMLAGNTMPDGAEPLSMAYAGQQFGQWSPQLGDGRAHLLGEVTGADAKRYDIQLKGSGRTPWSRGGDGRSWLGPVLREYIVSEAMHALGVPTTRALAAVETGEAVIREQELPGAVFTRVSRSLVRVGNFQFFAIRGDVESLSKLTDYIVARLGLETDGEPPALTLLRHTINAQAELVARWMGLGFIHGVMNTDNVSVIGETIDYGPCAFMDAYHANRVFSSIDEMGRYSFSNQPKIAHWNLVQFTQALLPLLGKSEEDQVTAGQSAVDAYPAIYDTAFAAVSRSKLGLADEQDGDVALYEDLLAILQEEKADFTNSFRALTESSGGEAFRATFIDLARIDAWLNRWRERLSAEGRTPEEAATIMRTANPVLIPRNHRVDQAIVSAMNGDYAPFHRLNAALATPFDSGPQYADLTAAPEPNEVVRYTFCGT